RIRDCRRKVSYPCAISIKNRPLHRRGGVGLTKCHASCAHSTAATEGRADHVLQQNCRRKSDWAWQASRCIRDDPPSCSAHMISARSEDWFWGGGGTRSGEQRCYVMQRAGECQLSFRAAIRSK